MSRVRACAVRSDLAFPPHDADLGSAICSMAMARKTYGPRVVAALVPRYFKDLTALHVGTGHAYSTVHDWSTGKADPRLDALEKIVEVLAARGERVDLLDLLRSNDETRVEYNERYPNRAAVLALLGREADERAVKRVASIELAAHEDPSKLWWTQRLADEVARVKREDEHPEAIAKEKAESARELDEAEAEAVRRKQRALERAKKPDPEPKKKGPGK